MRNNTSLKELDCPNTGITSLDVSKNTLLYHLDFSGTRITSLDVRNNTSLTSLNVSGCTSLENLYCSASVTKNNKTGKYTMVLTTLNGVFDTSKVSNIGIYSGNNTIIDCGKIDIQNYGFLLEQVPNVNGGYLRYTYDGKMNVFVYDKSNNNGTSAGDNGNTSGGNTTDGNNGNTTDNTNPSGGTTGDNTTDNTTTPETPAITKGSVVTDSASQAKYKVTDAAKKTVEYTASTQKKAKKVTVPASVKINGVSYKVTSVAKNAFAKNTSVTTITIGNNVTSIGANAFSDCKKLTSVTVGKNVKSIGKKAFYNCKKLKTITIKSTKLTKKNVGAQAFKNVNVKAKVKVPKSMVKSYKKLFVSKGLNKKVKIAKI